MPTYRSLLPALAFAVLPALAMAAEKDVSFEVEGQKVIGTLNLPDGVSNPPVILLLHGFTGSRHELEIPAAKEGIFVRAARMWAEEGIASLRIDFRGSGESDGVFADTTIDGQVTDGLAALDYLAASEEVDDGRMALVGWSQGGAVGAAVAGRTGHDLDAVALWAPGTNMAASITMLMGPDKVKEGLASGGEPVDVKLPWMDIQLKSGYFESLFRIDPPAEIEGYDGPLFVAVGTNDETVFPQPAAGQVLLDYHDGEEELFVRPMDHVFNAFAGTEMVDELIAATGEYISQRFD